MREFNLNNHIVLLKRSCVTSKKCDITIECLICIRDNRNATSKRFDNADFLFNHLKNAHLGDVNRKTVLTLAKNLKIMIELGMIST